MPELIPAAKEASKLCEVCGSWHVDDTFNFYYGWSVTFVSMIVKEGCSHCRLGFVKNVELVTHFQNYMTIILLY